MAFDANKMQVFSQRMQNLLRELRQLYIEAGDLDDIYLNEAASGVDAAWADTEIATAAEHVDGIIVARRLRDALAFDGQTAAIVSEDQTSRFTPFLQ